MRTPLDRIPGVSVDRRRASGNNNNSNNGTHSNSNSAPPWGRAAALVAPPATAARVAHASVMATLAPTNESTRFAQRRQVYVESRKLRPLEFAGERAGGGGGYVSRALDVQRALDGAAQRLGSGELWAKVRPFAERDLKAITNSDDVEWLVTIVKALVRAAANARARRTTPPD